MMSSSFIPPNVTVETLCDYIEMLDEKQRVFRGVSNSALLIPVEGVLKLLNTSLRELLRAVRVHKPYLPVDKTFSKLIMEPHRTPSRGTLLRILREAPHQQMLQALVDQNESGYSWIEGEAWRSLFSSRLFIHQAARDFWVDFVQNAKTLNAVDMYSAQSHVMQLHIYADSPLVDRFGCSTIRAVLHRRLKDCRIEGLAVDDQVIKHVVASDRFAVLLRILAWLVADMVIDIWEMVEMDGMQDITPFESLLPTIDPVTGEWNNPTTRALEQLAKRAGWQGKQRAITFLGNLWDRHDLEEKEPGSRIRSLRNWEQRRKGRPKFETLCSLAHAVTAEQALLAGVSPEGRESDSWIQAAILRIGETLSEILYALNKLGIEATHIMGIMDAYRQEYRFARAALGKPMSQL